MNFPKVRQQGRQGAVVHCSSTWWKHSESSRTSQPPYLLKKPILNVPEIFCCGLMWHDQVLRDCRHVTINMITRPAHSEDESSINYLGLSPLINPSIIIPHTFF